jgi:hypothetical protein
VVRWNIVPHAGNDSCIAELSLMARAGPNPSHLRALQRLCTEQAALAIDEVTRRTLLGMAAAYRHQAERRERELPKQD